jgi:hypothetical protein
MPETSRAWWDRLSRVLRPRGRGEENGASAAVHAFRAEVQAAVTDPGNRAALTGLLVRPSALGLADEEVELEIEVLQGALELLTLQDRVAESGLPIVPNQHKALGGERCHFAASAFLATEAAQRTGRLFLTERRLVFLTTPLISLPWGAIGRIEDEDRDLIVVAPGRGVSHRFRCNSYSDAKCARWIGAMLQGQEPEVQGHK